ncbi:hypothetical protein RvY_14432 [Ramazzottius varieornatus]|uniref:Uncharacterized protein n=1 Tax=Ramazzottius varieornatus TaxID=947166 RepID=A0A1D1VV33_RAMVA|nr:hypothetical protein RvY_14432 [Ramazzottius varieornatus]
MEDLMATLVVSARQTDSPSNRYNRFRPAVISPEDEKRENSVAGGKAAVLYGSEIYQ